MLEREEQDNERGCGGGVCVCVCVCACVRVCVAINGLKPPVFFLGEERSQVPSPGLFKDILKLAF